MTSRERLNLIFAGQAADRCGFWLGMPHSDTLPICLKHFNVPNEDALRLSYFAGEPKAHEELFPALPSVHVHPSLFLFHRAGLRRVPLCASCVPARH